MLLPVIVCHLLVMLLLGFRHPAARCWQHGQSCMGLSDQQLMRRHAQVTHPDFSASQDMSDPGATPANSPMAVPRAEPESARQSRFSTAQSQPQAQLQELLAAEKVSRSTAFLQHERKEAGPPPRPPPPPGHVLGVLLDGAGECGRSQTLA